MTSNSRAAYELLATDFRDLRTECVFGLMSDDTARLVTTLDAVGVKFHGSRHENTAAAMAGGICGRLGQAGYCNHRSRPRRRQRDPRCDVCPAHGLTRTPGVRRGFNCRAGRRRPTGPDGKAFDTAGALRAAGIPVYRPTNGTHARQLLQDAVAASARVGTVALLLPVDAQAEMLDPEASKPKPPALAEPAPLTPRLPALAAAARMLQVCRKPLIVAGYGVWRSGARRRTCRACRSPRRGACYHAQGARSVPRAPVRLRRRGLVFTFRRAAPDGTGRMGYWCSVPGSITGPPATARLGPRKCR